MAGKRAGRVSEKSDSSKPSKTTKPKSTQIAEVGKVSRKTGKQVDTATLQRTIGNQQLAHLANQVVMRAPDEAAQPAPAVPPTKEERMAYVMKLLVDKYKYPVNGAAGLVGNLSAESQLLPNLLEGSQPAAPMRGVDAKGKMTDFTPEDVMNRKHKVQGPKMPGIGIAQWTEASRRKGLFAHEYEGKKLGAAILNHLDAQVDYLVKELESNYKRVNKVLKNPESLEAASDEVVFNFERPGSVLKDKTDKDGKKISGKTLRSRDAPAVQDVLEERRKHGRDALAAFNGKK